MDCFWFCFVFIFFVFYIFVIYFKTAWRARFHYLVHLKVVFDSPASGQGCSAETANGHVGMRGAMGVFLYKLSTYHS